MQQLDRNVSHIASMLPALQGLSNKDASDRFYKGAVAEWNGLGPDKQKLYTNSATKGESGFYYFINKRAADMLQKLNSSQ